MCAFTSIVSGPDTALTLLNVNATQVVLSSRTLKEMSGSLNLERFISSILMAMYHAMFACDPGTVIAGGLAAVHGGLHLGSVVPAGGSAGGVGSAAHELEACGSICELLACACMGSGGATPTPAAAAGGGS